MNIFVLDNDPVKAARMVCDSHASKMCVEGIQMLVSALLNNGAPADKMPLTKTTGRPHKGGYKNHPATKWASENLSNWVWLLSHTQELCSEFTRRFGGKHFAETQLNALFGACAWEDYIPDAEEKTPFARCLNQSQGRNLDLLDTDNYTAVEAYREFYRRDKVSIAKWEKGTPAPDWWYSEEVTA
tara:strand:+ start:5563 stop:6117 length:555 start_codon:yes stop_codon:yes gene_type:complete